MNLDTINKWLTLAANLGVLVGIFFLAFEIRLNQQSLDEANNLNRLSATTAAFEFYDRHRTYLLENENLMQVWVKGRNDEPLSEIEQVQFEELCGNLYWGQNNSYERYLELGNEAGARGIVAGVISGFYDYPGLVKCYSEMKDLLVSFGYDPFVEAVANYEDR